MTARAGPMPAAQTPPTVLPAAAAA
jgi:hypothetical protein